MLRFFEDTSLKMRKSKPGEVHFRFFGPFCEKFVNFVRICLVMSGMVIAWKWDEILQTAISCKFTSKTSPFLLNFLQKLFQKLLYLRKSSKQQRKDVHKYAFNLPKTSFLLTYQLIWIHSQTDWEFFANFYWKFRLDFCILFPNKHLLIHFNVHRDN